MGKVIVYKHIKKKFLTQGYNVKLKPGAIPTIVDIDQPQSLKQFSKETVIMMKQKATGDSVFGFIYSKNGEDCVVPLPDFALCSFNFAYHLKKDILTKRNELLKKLRNKITTEDTNNELYLFFSLSSAFIVNLYMSLEAYVNRKLPEPCKIKNGNGDFKTITKAECQKKFSTKQKIKEILPLYYEHKDYFKNIGRTYKDSISGLNNLRDEIVHMKFDATYKPSISVFRKLLDFNYQNALNAVADLMNFYENNYVEPCDCADEF